MIRETLDDQRDFQAGIVEMPHHLLALIDDFLAQHAFNYTKETLIALVPHLNSETNYYNLGALLHYLLRRCQHREFRSILDDNEISPRTATYLIAIYVKLNALKIPCPLDVPWRTLGEAVRIINAINYEEIIDLCRKSSADEVREFIRKGGGK